MINKIRKGILFVLSYFGFYPVQLGQNLRGVFQYWSEYRLFKKQAKDYTNWRFRFYPIFTDKYDQSGKARGQYFYQDLHVANLIFKANPKKHVDVGSRIDGFVSHLASFREVEVLDIRPLDSDILNVKFKQADLMQMQDELRESTESLSCLHTIEHFGLGRYGDPIDADGHLKGLKSLTEMLKPAGLFYFSTQIGKSRIEFNAHRVFDVQYLLDVFRPDFDLELFSYIDDSDKLHTNVTLSDEDIARNFGCKLGCGIFVLRKKA
ncbi:DUF268 domain-containing protein [Marinilongibacter aquaticus]|uniref:DUF268 domain-containing protein n=1 Tax=Marinilongibacter aquaticus TaxID=2975157 RepID=UPI0021BD80F7|nr:DUF268 domain-containing protein [Marinilongibacter aquaticus]UBM58909.1 DUF268 domain-containing protein [Marinilongibacter aquaticus]